MSKSKGQMSKQTTTIFNKAIYQRTNQITNPEPPLPSQQTPNDQRQTKYT